MRGWLSGQTQCCIPPHGPSFPSRGSALLRHQAQRGGPKPATPAVRGGHRCLHLGFRTTSRHYCRCVSHHEIPTKEPLQYVRGGWTQYGPSPPGGGSWEAGKAHTEVPQRVHHWLRGHTARVGPTQPGPLTVGQGGQRSHPPTGLCCPQAPEGPVECEARAPGLPSARCPKP